MIKTSEEFRDLFQITESKDYFEPTIIRDTKCGFSIKRHYPKNILYKPPLRKDGTPLDFAIIWIVSDVNNIREEDDYIPLIIRISRSHIFSYNYKGIIEDDDPTSESLDISINSPHPEDIKYSGFFSYKPRSNKFYKEDEEISGIDILDFVFDEHCNSVRILERLEFRIKAITKKIFATCQKIPLGLSTYIYEKVSGNYINFINRANYVETKLDIKSQDPVDIFGYKTSRSSLIVFSLIVCASNLLAYNNITNIQYIINISNSSFLLFVHSVVLITLIEMLPRKVILWYFEFLHVVQSKLLETHYEDYGYKWWIKKSIYILYTIEVLWISGELSFINMK